MHNLGRPLLKDQRPSKVASKRTWSSRGAWLSRLESPPGELRRNPHREALGRLLPTTPHQMSVDREDRQRQYSTTQQARRARAVVQEAPPYQEGADRRAEPRWRDHACPPVPQRAHPACREDLQFGAPDERARRDGRREPHPDDERASVGRRQVVFNFCFLLVCYACVYDLYVKAN
jgi:hypothetical protein